MTNGVASRQQPPRPVGITGMGAVTPMGSGFEVLLDGWLAGKVAPASDSAAACADFDPAGVMTTKEIRRSDRMTQYAMAATVQATQQAGWERELPVPPARIACIIGTALGGLTSLQREVVKFAERGPKAISPLAIPLSMHNGTVAMLAMRLGIRGPICSVTSACASGTDAIGMGMRWIREGYVDAVVAGGADASALEFAVSAFRVVGSLSPTGVARPFDARRDGFVMGEGAGVMILEAVDSAEERGAEVLGQVLGYGGSSDALHPTRPDPEGRFAAAAIREALDDAGVEPPEVAYVNAHGTGTVLNDRSETRAIKAALGEHAYDVPISSTKSVIGHAMGPAGAVEAGASLLALRRGVVPPTVNHSTPEQDLDLDYNPVGTNGARPLTRARPAGNAIALSNSFGFGGHNGVLCLSAPAGSARNGL